MVDRNPKKRKLSHDKNKFNLKQMKNNDNEEEHLDRLLALQNFKRVKIYGDGHCFFKAIFLHLHNRMPKICEIFDFRKEISTYLEGNKNQYRNFFIFSDNEERFQKAFAKYIEGLKSNLWGGDLEMRILSNMMNLNIHVIEKYNLTRREFSLRNIHDFISNNNSFNDVYVLH